MDNNEKNEALKFRIRNLTRLEEMDEVEALQRAVWDAPSTVIYRHMLISFARNGGSVLGAYKDGKLIGFLISFLGLEDPESERPAMANLKLVSQRMAILPEFRNSGVGYELKLAQRQYAVSHGIRLVTWTFDPMQSRNAYLNIHKLGAIVHEYYRDYYGTEPGPLVTAHSSDRLLAEWWVTSNRVDRRINDKRAALRIHQYIEGNATLVNPSQFDVSGHIHPANEIQKPKSALALLEIPSDFDHVNRTAPEIGEIWRVHVRQAMESLLSSGYTITDFVHGHYENHIRSFYVLSYTDYNPDVQMTRFSSN